MLFFTVISYANIIDRNIRGIVSAKKRGVVMTTKKRYFSVLLAALAIACILVISLLFSCTIVAYAINGSNGTNTDGEWQTGQTQNLIPQIQAGDTWDTLVAKGWGKDNGTPALEVHETDGHGYGVRPTDDGRNADIGNHDYTGGIYYTIHLSDADRVKVDLQQLSIGASAWYSLQALTKYNLSVRAEFHTADGSDISVVSTTVEDSKGSGNGSRQLILKQTLVPKNTAYIEMWFSNSKNLYRPPWISDMQCYLYDSVAPSFESASLDDSGVINPAENIAIEGNTVKYFLQFNEKVSVTESGTAWLALQELQFASSSSTETINENGKTSVGYTFTLLPGSEDSGVLSLSSVSGLRVKDEAGNEYTYSGNPSAETLTYYGTMSVSAELTNIVTDGANTAKYGTDYTATLSARDGYELPTSVVITVGGTIISESEGYAYDPNSGFITVYGSYITDDISIKATGKAKESVVTFNQQNGSGGTDFVTAVYDGNMPEITVPSRTGYTFEGYYSESGGNGNKYYNEAGQGVKNCDFYLPITLYANWVANRYNIEFDKNKPENASGSVTGNTLASQRTYDDGEISLSANGFSLVGWTFKGWAESETALLSIQTDNRYRI